MRSAAVPRSKAGARSTRSSGSPSPASRRPRSSASPSQASRRPLGGAAQTHQSSNEGRQRQSARASSGSVIRRRQLVAAGGAVSAAANGTQSTPALAGEPLGATLCLFRAACEPGHSALGSVGLAASAQVFADLAKSKLEDPSAQTVLMEPNGGHGEVIERSEFLHRAARFWSLVPDSERHAAAQQMLAAAWALAPPPHVPCSGYEEDRAALSEVVSGSLWLTGWRGAANREAVSTLGITHVLSVGSEFEGEEPLGDLGLQYLVISVTDDEDQREAMGAELRRAASWIAAAIRGGGRVIVHCAAGISRSATVVLGFLVLEHSIPLFTAFEQVRAARSVTWPNYGFMEALCALECEALGVSVPSVAIDEYKAWSEFDPEEYAAARKVERPSQSPSEIVPGLLFLGSEENASNAKMQLSLGITLVINCAEEVDVGEEVRAARKVRELELRDSPYTKIQDLIPSVISDIEKQGLQGGCTLVNCREGRSRSAAFVLAFLMHHQKEDLAAVFAHVRAKRPIVDPNVGFMKHLRDVEFSLRQNDRPSLPLNEEDWQLLLDLELVTPEDRFFYTGSCADSGS